MEQENSFFSQESNSSNKNETLTLYYSNFALFDKEATITFSVYQDFKDQLEENLGEDWNEYAKYVIYDQQQDGTIRYFGSGYFYNQVLQIWLETRRAQSIQKFQQGLDESFHITEEFEDINSIKLLEVRFILKNHKYQLNKQMLYPLLEAFHITAVDIWKKIFLKVIKDNQTKKNILNQILKYPKNFIMQKLKELRKSKSKQINQIDTYQLFSLIQPLLIVSEKVLDYLSKDQREMNDQMNNDKEERNNFTQFHQNMELEIKNPEQEKEEQQIQLKQEDNLNSTFNTEKQQQKQIQVQEFPKNISTKINPNMLALGTEFVGKLLINSDRKWQITKDFVYTICEMNYSTLQTLEQKLFNHKNPVSDQVKIRFLQPAQEFYNSLMDIWIIFVSNTYKTEIVFKDFLERVKDSMGDLWSDKLYKPTQLFFMTMISEWNKLNKIQKGQKLKVFITQVRQQLFEVWKQTVAEKTKDLQQENLSKNEVKVQKNELNTSKQPIETFLNGQNGNKNESMELE